MARVRTRKGQSATEHGLTVSEIRARLANADRSEYEALKRSLSSDTRAGVKQALRSCEKRLDAASAELSRVKKLYEFQESLAEGKGEGFVLGIDEVGRGSIAGPLAAGGVVLPQEPLLLGINDSKQLSPAAREEIAAQIRETALFAAVEYVAPEAIDMQGMTASLKQAFSAVIARCESAGFPIACVLLDGNPIHVDPREVNVVKGDAKCASIACASIIAKVERDALMVSYAEEYPEYGFDGNKGYASAEHVEAIKRVGLCPIHRKTFCTGFLQETLF